MERHRGEDGNDNEVFLKFSHLQFQCKGDTRFTWKFMTPPSAYGPNRSSWLGPSLSSNFCCLVAKSCSALYDLLDCSTPGFFVLRSLLEFTQTSIDDAIQPSHLLLSPYPPAFNLSQHQGLFQWVGSLYQVAKVLKFQHQYFQWIFRVDFL